MERTHGIATLSPETTLSPALSAGNTCVANNARREGLKILRYDGRWEKENWEKRESVRE